MTTRRGGRPDHVRRRPPSTGLPAAIKVRARPPAPGRLALHKPAPRKSRLPLLVRAALVVGVVALGGAAFFVGTGGIAKLVASLGTTFTGFLDTVTATPKPTATDLLVSDSPLITAPAEPYTNQSKVDLTVKVPGTATTTAGSKVRVYLALEGQLPAIIEEVPVEGSAKVVIPVTLEKGQNEFTATIVDIGGESESSPVVTYVLDTDPPTITVTAPKKGATINRATVAIVGKTQARSTLVARNEANGSSITGTAEGDGSFSLTLPIEPGPNGINIDATDPAGNPANLVLNVQRGSGVLTAILTASTYRVTIGKLPLEMQLTARVTDPDGHPLEGAAVTFSLTIPGIPALTFDAVTSGDGRTVFVTTLPKGVTAGAGLATILVTTADFGTTTDKTVITVSK